MVWVLSTLKPFTKLGHATYYSYITSFLHLQVLLVTTEDVFCISNIHTNTSGEWAMQLQYTSRGHCKTLTAASLFQIPGLWLRRLKELRRNPTTFSVIYGYLDLVSYGNSKRALSGVLKHFLLAVNKWKVTDQATCILLMEKKYADVLWRDYSDQRYEGRAILFSLLQEVRGNCPSSRQSHHQVHCEAQSYSCCYRHGKKKNLRTSPSKEHSNHILTISI